MVGIDRSLPQEGLDGNLLFMGVQGYEHELISGLHLDRLPAWVMLEQDMPGSDIENLMSSLGYRREVAGDNPCCSLIGSEVLLERTNAVSA